MLIAVNWSVIFKGENIKSSSVGEMAKQKSEDEGIGAEGTGKDARNHRDRLRTRTKTGDGNLFYFFLICSEWRWGKNGVNILNTWIFTHLNDSESHVSRDKGWQNQRISRRSVSPSKKLRTQEFNEGFRPPMFLTNGRDMQVTGIQVSGLWLPPTRGWVAWRTEVLVPTPR